MLEWLPLLKMRYRFLYERLVTGPTLTLAHGDCHLDNLFFADRYPHGWYLSCRPTRLTCPTSLAARHSHLLTPTAPSRAAAR